MIPFVISPWGDEWIHCERCGEWLDAEHATVVQLMIPRMKVKNKKLSFYFVPHDTAVHTDREYCKAALLADYEHHNAGEGP